MTPAHNDVEHVRALAREGMLTKIYVGAAPEERRRLSGGVIAVASPVVFLQLTRVIELKRGHARCAVGMNRLSDTCLDRFYDDLEAVTYDILHNATICIANLEGWLACRIRGATIDAHRRRRGARGAQQRPRLPVWLDRELGHDPWLGHLAVEILTWVGVTATAGVSLWPLDSWSDQRVAFTGARASDDTRAVVREVERVLAAMRTRPNWFKDYVERPLGAKIPPTVDPSGSTAGGKPLALAEPHEILEARLAELASLALAAIKDQVAKGVDLAAAVVDVIGRVFGRLDVLREIGEPPHAMTSADERITALVDDPTQLAHIVQVIQDILGRSGPLVGRR